MTDSLRISAEAALAERLLRFIECDDGKLCVLFRNDDGTRFEVFVVLNEAGSEAYLIGQVSQVLPGATSAAIDLVMTYNKRFPFVKFNLGDDNIFLDVAVELTAAAEPAVLIGLGLDRLMYAYAETRDEIAEAMVANSTISSDAEAILDSLGF